MKAGRKKNLAHKQGPKNQETVAGNTLDKAKDEVNQLEAEEKEDSEPKMGID